MEINWERVASVPLKIVFGFAGLVQIYLACIGLEHHLGWWAAMGCLAVAVLFRFMLPPTVGTHFGVVNVVGWHWWVGVWVAAPGIIFMSSAFVYALVRTETDRFRN